ncbi:MAG: polysaccharide pyruvyl transferase family protein, partial [Candidatus Obscuribacter sp.]|nr:polysaccharide pyruvyl transferase family protein [Candidatus Obscuribacter sp.]
MAVFVRQLIVVSGYYGFDNLGDEAILEELVRELKSLWPAKDIVILSQNPESTAARFGVRAQNRWQLSEIAVLLRQCKLFISGGGGLFQDSESVKSVIYYGGLISLATLCGAPTLIYAQGLGPLKSALGKALTRFSLVQAKQLSVR